MKRLLILLSIFVSFISIIVYYTPELQAALQILDFTFISNTLLSKLATTNNTSAQPTTTPMTSKIARSAMSTLHHATIKPLRSSTRGHSDHGWLNTYHSFSFAGWYNPALTQFGSLRVLNEDRVKPNSGFPTHRHADFEIFSYILSGELTHRDSTMTQATDADGAGKEDLFSRMKRGDVQFTTGGRGISHSEFNEHNKDTVHFLQIWAKPWKRGLTPAYHTKHFDEAAKREGFVKILSPLKAGPEASEKEDREAVPAVEGTIPIHADFVMAAGIIKPGERFEWSVGGGEGVTTEGKRKVFVHLPMTKGGKASVRIDGREEAVLNEGDGVFVEGVSQGDRLGVESLGTEEAEVVVLDTC